MLKVKFHFYHLFYWLTILLIIFGLILVNLPSYTSDAPGWHAKLINWWNLIPMAIYSLLLGLIYRYWNSKGKPISKFITILHFILTLIGLNASINLFSLIAILINSDVDFSAIAFGPYFLLMFFGPIILLIS